MRAAKADDAWRNSKQLENYRLRIKRLVINESDRYSDGFELSFVSGLNAICGRNGVGKSNILRKIYDLSKGNISCGEVTFEHFDKSKKTTTLSNSNNESIYYVEPSIECSKIISYLKQTTNSEELKEGVEPNAFFSSMKNICLLKQIVGKPYRNIYLYEIEGAMHDDYTFPYIIVEMDNGLRYTCSDMGMGEFLCFYIVWFLQWAEKNSIVLIEELENFISAHSQNNLINYLASVSSSRSLWVLVTSHSEYILNKFDSQSLFLISQCKYGKTKIVHYNSEKQYKDALGIALRKNSSILFEDHFAQLFAHLILSRMNVPILHFAGLFHVKGGESDLEKIAAHFQPVGAFNHNIACVFDADLSDKVVASNSKFIPVLALPSSNSLNPEEELWTTISRSHLNVANKINLDSDLLLEAINNYGNSDHHERFQLIASSIQRPLSSLLEGAIDVWLQDSINFSLAREFVFALVVRGMVFDNFEQVSDLYLKHFGGNIPEKYVELYFQIVQFKVTFDGNKLIFH